MAPVSIAAFFTSLSAGAQGLIHYKFDAGGGASIVNYAASTLAPREARLNVLKASQNPDLSWARGRFGQAYDAANNLNIDTGWREYFFVGHRQVTPL